MVYPVFLFSSFERLCKSDENKVITHIYISHIMSSDKTEQTHKLE